MEGEKGTRRDVIGSLVGVLAAVCLVVGRLSTDSRGRLPAQRRKRTPPKNTRDRAEFPGALAEVK